MPSSAVKSHTCIQQPKGQLTETAPQCAGKVGEDVHWWVSRVGTMLDLYKWDQEVRLWAAVALLTDHAATWFDERQKSDQGKITTWTELAAEVSANFAHGDPLGAARRRLKELKCEIGKEAEYIQAFRELVPRLKPHYSDELLYQGLREKATLQTARDRFFVDKTLSLEKAYGILLGYAASSLEDAKSKPWKSPTVSKHRQQQTRRAKNIQWSSSKREPVKCYECKKEGHIHRFCPKLVPRRQDRSTTSSYGTAAVNIPKKDGSTRICIDYLALNAITVKNQASFPYIDDLFDTLQEATIFSEIDLA
jgi:hypothetical protein